MNRMLLSRVDHRDCRCYTPGLCLYQGHVWMDKNYGVALMSLTINNKAASSSSIPSCDVFILVVIPVIRYALYRKE